MRGYVFCEIDFQTFKIYQREHLVKYFMSPTVIFLNHSYFYSSCSLSIQASTSWTEQWDQRGYSLKRLRTWRQSRHVIPTRLYCFSHCQTPVKEGRKKERQLFIAWMGEGSQGCGLQSPGTRLVLPSLTGWVTLGKSLTLCALVPTSAPML